ncbi:WecB/TagA/CpsF family glycosyltransferase [uncultured Roseovarius sp.]|uniref:WecB/TagA/CpsF family glycosyltransferase n=1 Tax=uncultured Roseovarius sp. TaxID=293344 RepID=UPI00262B141F|nr:WecB/TagA/CpsF family glycosyltransferase [uncultured Roseovarius sp.]
MEFHIRNRVIRIEPRDQAALLSVLRHRLSQRTGFALATINLDHLVKLASDPQFLDAYAQHDLVVADGNPIVWLSRLARRPVGLVPGSDMIVPMARLAAEANVSVALVGSTETALKAAEDGLSNSVPGLRIAARIAPPMGFDPLGEPGDIVIDQLKATDAGLCLLALGAPKQEIFAARAHARLPHMGFASIGAGLDFIAGQQRRAPLWIRRLALEWLWRALSSPRRMVPRYAQCAMILPYHAWQAWLLR